MTCTHFTFVFRFALVLSLSAALVTGCGGDEPAGQATANGDSSQMIQREAPRRTAVIEPEPEPARDFLVVPDFEGELEEDGLGLETIIDASSKDAYAESMRWISQDVSASQYKRLEQSLRYIKAFDSNVLGSETRFLQAIDGRTGQELIDRASKLIAERRR